MSKSRDDAERCWWHPDATVLVLLFISLLTLPLIYCVSFGPVMGYAFDRLDDHGDERTLDTALVIYRPLIAVVPLQVADKFTRESDLDDISMFMLWHYPDSRAEDFVFSIGTPKFYECD